jgi:hypothetical protein
MLTENFLKFLRCYYRSILRQRPAEAGVPVQVTFSQEFYMTRALLSIGIAFITFNGVAFGLGGGSVILLRGDANNDSQVNSSDPVYISNYLFNGGSSPPCLDAADANDDGAVDITDVSYLNSYLYMGGPAPRSPFPYCGSDPTSDSLGCNSSACP